MFGWNLFCCDSICCGVGVVESAGAGVVLVGVLMVVVVGVDGCEEGGEVLGEELLEEGAGLVRQSIFLALARLNTDISNN